VTTCPRRSASNDTKRADHLSVLCGSIEP